MRGTGVWARVGRGLSATLAGLLLVVAGVTATPAPAAEAAAPGWLHTKGSQILTASGKVHVIKAVAWFGMETPECAPHGLWSISLDEGMRQIAEMGFNTIRLPFSNECLAARSSSSIDAYRNPRLAQLTPLKLLDAVIARAKAYGLSVILDRHRPDSAAQSELWYTDRFSESRWISDWKMLAKRYRADSTVIGVDLHNEPHGAACWGCGDRSRDWHAAATRAGNAILAINPKLLIIVEGVEREQDGSWTWWGGGLRGVATTPVQLSVKNRVVYSPHDYPASVHPQSWFASSKYPANLPAMWDRNWGYIQKRGIAPVLLGEFGTKLQTTSDKAWLKTLVRYLANRKISYAYWSFNPDSGDTGGLVADDWRTRQQAKLAYLRPILTPVKVGAVPTLPGGTAPQPPPASPPPTTPKPPAGPVADAKKRGKTVTVTWHLDNAWGEGYLVTLRADAHARTNGWKVSWAAPGATAVTSSWGARCVLNSGRIICSASDDWAKNLQSGQSVQVGLQVATTRAPATPKLTVTP